MKKEYPRLQLLRRVLTGSGESAPPALQARAGSLALYRSGKPLRYAKDSINYTVPVAVLILIVLGFGFPWWLGFAVGVMVYSGLFFVLNARPPREQEQVDLRAEIRQKLAECGDAIERLREMAPQVAKTEVRARLASIVATAANLVRDLWELPSTTLTTATRFQFVTAETLRLLKTYLQIERGEISVEAEKLQPLVRKIEEDLLPQLQTALRDFAVKLDQSELLSLEATIGVLESTLRIEGMS
jgi:hypothetical protein